MSEAERMQVALERRRRRVPQRRGGGAKHGRAPGADDQRDGLAGLGDRAAEQRVGRFAAFGAVTTPGRFSTG